MRYRCSIDTRYSNERGAPGRMLIGQEGIEITIPCLNRGRIEVPLGMNDFSSVVMCGTR